RIPGDGGEQLDDLPAEAEAISATLLDAFDRQRQVDLAARLAPRHLRLGHSPQALIAPLARAVLREDAGFHAYQMLEAGVRQFTEWGNTNEGRHILIAVTRYFAAHSPTERAALQTADIARRLMLGGELHRQAGAARAPTGRRVCRRPHCGDMNLRYFRSTSSSTKNLACVYASCAGTGRSHGRPTAALRVLPWSVSGR